MGVETMPALWRGVSVNRDPDLRSGLLVPNVDRVYAHSTDAKTHATGPQGQQHTGAIRLLLRRARARRNGWRVHGTRRRAGGVDLQVRHLGPRRRHRAGHVRPGAWREVGRATSRGRAPALRASLWGCRRPSTRTGRQGPCHFHSGLQTWSRRELGHREGALESKSDRQVDQLLLEGQEAALTAALHAAFDLE